jgi:hypothetical protein
MKKQLPLATFILSLWFCPLCFAQTTTTTTQMSTNNASTVVKKSDATETNQPVDPIHNPYNIQDNSNLIFINTPDNPGPVYVNTGNVEEDTKNYKKVKDQWIKENTIVKEEEKKEETSPQ